VGDEAFTNLDFVDYVSLLASMLDICILALVLNRALRQLEEAAKVDRSDRVCMKALDRIIFIWCPYVNMYISQMLLCGADTRSVTSIASGSIDAYDQWCLRQSSKFNVIHLNNNVLRGSCIILSKEMSLQPIFELSTADGSGV